MLAISGIRVTQIGAKGCVVGEDLTPYRTLIFHTWQSTLASCSTGCHHLYLARLLIKTKALEKMIWNKDS